MALLCCHGGGQHPGWARGLLAPTAPAPSTQQLLTWAAQDPASVLILVPVLILMVILVLMAMPVLMVILVLVLMAMPVLIPMLTVMPVLTVTPVLI